MNVGWQNFIIVPSLKLAVEVSRQIDGDSVERLSNSIVQLFDEEASVYDLLDEPFSKLSSKNFSEIVKKASCAEDLSGKYFDDLFAVWLKLRKIDFQIISEFDFEKLDKKGLKILRMG
jgi:hypothetical protein